MVLCFKNTKKDIIMIDKVEKHYRDNNLCRLCEKKIEFDKIRDDCHLTSKSGGPAHNNCTFVVTQKQSNFIPFALRNFGNYEFHLFFKRLVDKKNGKVKFDKLPKTNEK